MIASTIHSIVSSARPSHEDFDTSGNNQLTTDNGWVIAASLITMVIIILILSLIGMYLWNEIVAGSGKGKGLFTFAKRVDNIWQILGLYILISLLFGCQNTYVQK